MKLSVVALPFVIASVASAAAVPRPHAKRSSAPCTDATGNVNFDGVDPNSIHSLAINKNGTPLVNGQPVQSCADLANAAGGSTSSSSSSPKSSSKPKSNSNSNTAAPGAPCVDASGEVNMSGVDPSSIHSLAINGDGTPLINGKPVKNCADVQSALTSKRWELSITKRSKTPCVDANGEVDINGLDPDTVKSLAIDADGTPMLNGKPVKSCASISKALKSPKEKRSKTPCVDANGEVDINGLDPDTVKSLAIDEDGTPLLNGKPVKSCASISKALKSSKAKRSKTPCVDANGEVDINGLDPDTVKSLAIDADGTPMLNGKPVKSCASISKALKSSKDKRSTTPCVDANGEVDTSGLDANTLKSLSIDADGTPRINGQPVQSCADVNNALTGSSEKHHKSSSKRSSSTTSTTSLTKRAGSSPCVDASGQVTNVGNGDPNSLQSISIGRDGPEINGKPVKSCSDLDDALNSDNKDKDKDDDDDHKSSSHSATSSSTGSEPSRTAPANNENTNNNAASDDDKNDSAAMGLRAAPTMGVLVAIGATLVMMF